MNHDAEHAEMIRRSVEQLNKAIMEAARTGLEVELEVLHASIFGKGEVEKVYYCVFRTVKRG